MESCLYSGWVSHRRTAPKPHAFRRRLWFIYLDLAEQDQLFAARGWGARGLGIVRFHPSDYGPRPPARRIARGAATGTCPVPLAERIRDQVAALGRARPTGPIRLLTQPRQFGYLFNPLSLYFCFAPDGQHLEHLLAEVGNTPWGERHWYCLDATSARPGRASHAKQFHVSPFLPMDMEYAWRWSQPGPRLGVRIQARREQRCVFAASLNLRRHEFSSGNLSRLLCLHPCQTQRVTAAIYWQALRLRLAGCPLFAHPHKLSPSSLATRKWEKVTVDER